MNYYSSKRGENDPHENMMNHLEIITKIIMIYNERVSKIRRIKEISSFNVRNQRCRRKLFLR